MRAKTTLKGAASNQACAACKHQRKRCTPECALAPHFRPEHPKVFKNAHKLFGVRNILRILEQINPDHKTEAMQTLIYEANMRDQFPVHGCLNVICDLQYQIRQAEEELYNVLTWLSFYKQHHEGQHVPTLSNGVDHGLLQPGNEALALFRQDFATTLPVSSCDNPNVCINAFWI
ncbi:putative transcription factor AS2-LOB family [Helianthus debilis subsp. tardiflorus]